MKRTLTILLSLALAMSLATACKKKDKKGADKKKGRKISKKVKPSKKSMKKVAKKIKKVKKVKKVNKVDMLTAKAYFAAWKNLKSCSFKKMEIDNACPALKALKKLRSAKKKEKKFYSKVSKKAKKWLDHKDAKVRFWAVTRFHSAFAGGVSKGDLKLLVARTEKEKELPVLHEIISVMRSSSNKLPEAHAFVKKMADNANEQIRKKALTALINVGRDDKEVIKLVHNKLKKDPSEKVRRSICYSQYDLWSDALLPTIKKILKDKKTSDKLYEACFAGIINMWNHSYFLKKPSKKAYKLSLAALAYKPRSQNRPPWTSLSNYGRVPKQHKTKKTPKWFKKKDVVKAMAKVLGDPKINFQAHLRMIEVMSKFGGKKELKKALKKIEKTKKFPYQSSVISSIKGKI